jgi:hypothetical protein
MSKANTSTPRSQSLFWVRTKSAEFPFELRSDGQLWRIRINDFPDEPMYTLFIEHEEIESFDDWPISWKKG